MLALIKMMNIITSTVFAVSFCTMYMLGYFGILLGSFFITIFTATVLFSINYPEEYLNIVKNSKYIVENIDTLDYQIIVSPCKQYYTYKGIHYDIAFPVFWVFHERPDTGPHHCDNCKDYGTFRGVFLMYCCNCARDMYDNNSVGHGAIENGVELIHSDYVEKSAWLTYLKYRDIKRIGLPHELARIDFDRPGYTYKLVTDEDIYGNIRRIYTDFVKDEELEEGEELEEDEDDTESDTTEVIH